MATLDQFVVNIRQLSTDGKFSDLAQTLSNPSIDHLSKNIQYIDSIIATFPLPDYSMCMLACLHAIAKAPNIPNFDAFLSQVDNFIQTSSAEQVQYLPQYLCEICHVITEQLRKENRARLGVPILYRAIELLRREPGQLLSIHSDLYQLCLLCQWFEPALTYLDADIVDINRENGKFDVKHLLLAYYYGGMIYACIKQFDRAGNFFENVITVPSQATSAIAIEAYKKYVLVKLISGSIPANPLPTYTSRTVQQTIGSVCGAQYTELFNIFNNQTLAQFDEFVNRHRDQYARDRNLGLIKQTRTAFICNSIQQLTKTFLTVSLKDLANRVQLQSTTEAERYLLDMIENEQIFASINKQDGMVIFHGSPEKFDANNMLAKLQDETEKRMQAEKQLRELERQISLNHIMQKSSSLFRPNTFRDSNETTAKHDLVEPSAPVEERMESNSPPRLSMVCPMEMDEQSSHRITNRPLTKSIFRANNRNDSDEANQEQTGREEMSHNDNIALEASGYDQSRLADLSADEAFALQLQQEEYSRDSLATARHPFFPFRVASDDESATASAPPYVVVDEHPSFPNDDELALYVHRQEQATRQRHYPYPRTLFGPRQRSNEHSQSGENDNEPVVPSPYPTFSFRNHSHNEDDSDEEDGYPNMRHPLFQYLLQQNGPLPEDFPAFLAGFPRQRRRRSGNLQDTEEDFGPEDYERLLRLDETVHKKKLTKEQINSIPIESFHRTSNTNTDEENKCGVCLDLFETNQALRRFPCRHVYHKECADRWLQENNVCPICREPPVKVQSATNSRHHRTMNSTHHHNQNRDNRRPTHTNRNPAPRPNTNFGNLRRGSSQRPS
ncbi:unnamed protein product [Adineta ricciae]|uniref:COP9 signalosome complex subunit 3 n=1 Tax=Adineta ricciae TaxID=249248 RepID=A0A813X0W0_ADIRI|nr:unnamed protein product [Adineta ricciae]